MLKCESFFVFATRPIQIYKGRTVKYRQQDPPKNFYLFIMLVKLKSVIRVTLSTTRVTIRPTYMGLCHHSSYSTILSHISTCTVFVSFLTQLRDAKEGKMFNGNRLQINFSGNCCQKVLAAVSTYCKNNNINIYRVIFCLLSVRISMMHS